MSKERSRSRSRSKNKINSYGQALDSNGRTRTVRQSIEKLKQIRPNVVIDIEYIRHGTYHDGKRLGDKISECDIYIPESVGWTEQSLQNKRAIAQRRRMPFMFTSDSMNRFKKGENRALFGSKKAVTYVDFTEEQASKLPESEDPFKWLFKYNVSFDEALNFIHNYAKTNAKKDKQRENTILRNLPDRIQEVIDQTESLQQKDALRVFLWQGAMHTRVYQFLKRNFKDIRRGFPYMPYVYSHYHELQRRELFNKKAEREHVAKALFEIIVTPLFRYQYQKNPQQTVAKIRTLVNSYSLADIESLYNQAISSGSGPWGIKDLVEDKLRCSDIELKPDKAHKTVLAWANAR